MSAQTPVGGAIIPFEIPSTKQPAATWYKVLGKLDTPPLIVLHGGPGAGHEYVTPLADMHEKYQMPVIFYDQIGCGQSTRFPDKMGDDTFWTFDLFIKELENLVSYFKLHELGFYLIGQSWGGMLGGVYAATKPAGLRKLILSSAPASFPLYASGCRELLSQMPEDVRKVIEDCEKNGDFESKEYESACMAFYSKHLCKLDPFPDSLMASLGHLQEDPGAYVTMQGPSEFTITGNLKDWEGWKDSHQIEVPTLLLNGRYDEVRDACVEPWFRTIPKVKWVTLEKSAHMTHYEERERFMELCKGFLHEH